MIARNFGLTLGCAVFCATTALGQAPSASKDVDVFFSAKRAPGTDLFLYQLVSAGPSDSATTAEDIEIFRRILEKTLDPWTGFLAWMTPVYETGAQGQPQPLFGGSSPVANYLGGGLSGNTGGGFSGYTWSTGPYLGLSNTSGTHWPRYTLAEHPAAKPEGVYLPGYGVVFTITLPWDGQDPMGKPATAEPKAISEWDRVRKEMRGEKLPERKEQAKKSPSLADTVLKVLAENGHHFTSLTTNERVTVAITLRPTTASGGTVILGGLNNMGTGGTPGGVHNRNPAGGANQGDRYAGPRSEAANLVNLGNQRLSQKRNDDAIEAYQKALDIYQKILDSYRRDGSNIQNRLSDVALAADAWSRLAKVYFSTGKKDEAEKMMQHIARAYEKLVESGMSGFAYGLAASKTPTKLIISATKPVLDRIGTGKMSLNDFRGEVKIDYFSLPQNGKGTTKAKEPKAGTP